MKKLTKLLTLALILSLCVSFVSCKKSDEYDPGASAPSYNDKSEIVNTDINRKIVYNVRIGIETEDIADLKKNISEKCESLGGHIQYNNENYSDGDFVYVSITYRIPTEKLDEFISSVEEHDGIKNKNISTNDITTSYVDTQAKKSSLEERKLLLENMLSDTTISASDRINIINEISSVSTEIQAISLMIEGYDSLVDYSTVTITMEEETPFWPVLVVLAVFIVVPTSIIGLIILIYDKHRKKKITDQ